MSWDVATYTGSAVAALTFGYFYDRRKRKRRAEHAQNHIVARNQAFRLVQDLKDKADSLDEETLKKYEHCVYDIYTSVLADKDAHEEILSEQLNLALDTIAAVEALRGNAIKENTPPEIKNVIESRLALEQSRKRISLFGKSKERDDDDDDEGGNSLPNTPPPADTPALAIENSEVDETSDSLPPIRRARSLMSYAEMGTSPQKLTRKRKKKRKSEAAVQDGGLTKELSHRSSQLFNWLAASVPLGRQD